MYTIGEIIKLTRRDVVIRIKTETEWQRLRDAGMKTTRQFYGDLYYSPDGTYINGTLESSGRWYKKNYPNCKLIESTEINTEKIQQYELY